jgi:hypothetical protein
MLLASVPLQFYLSAKYGTTCHGETLKKLPPAFLEHMQGLLILAPFPLASIGLFIDQHRKLASITLILALPVILVVGFVAGCN